MAGRKPIEAADSDPVIKPAARRALAEAEERRKARQTDASPREIGGRSGLEPTRFGDWESKGIASDF